MKGLPRRMARLNETDGRWILAELVPQNRKSWHRKVTFGLNFRRLGTPFASKPLEKESALSLYACIWTPMHTKHWYYLWCLYKQPIHVQENWGLKLELLDDVTINLENTKPKQHTLDDAQRNYIDTRTRRTSTLRLGCVKGRGKMHEP